MQSILRYTDMSLIREIMWISDGSKPDKVFAEQLKAMHRSVLVHENKNNLGLIVTKMNAAAQAKGSILMFLEPHILATPGWLPPLLNRITENPKVLIMPQLDVLDDRMTYSRSTYGLWKFEWSLNIVYGNPEQIPDSSTSKPYMSPGTSGGIYAIRKDFWDQLDFFDPGLTRWGGENTEASYKVWRCGGRIEIHPCSRIAHWFRVESNRPYDVNVQNLIKNYKRLAEVWFDNYTSHFYQRRPDARELDVGDLTEMRERRKLLEKRLHCKDMHWYIKHVDLEMGWQAEEAIRQTEQAADDSQPEEMPQVNCGGHYEPVCALCPGEDGLESQCNGDCKWVDGTCMPKVAEFNAGIPDFVPDLEDERQAASGDWIVDQPIPPDEYNRRTVFADAFKKSK